MAVICMSIGEKLRKLRDDQHWSQDTVAKLMNLHRSTISKYENGTTKPNYQTLLQFAKIFKIDKSYLVGDFHEDDDAKPTDGFVTKETLDDPELALIYELLQLEPELKKALVELRLKGPKERAWYAAIAVNVLKTKKPN